MELAKTENEALDVPENGQPNIIEWLRDQRTPLEMVETREGRGGQHFHYLRHQYVTETLNKVTGYNWNFEVVRERLEEDQVTVLGKLTIPVKGHEVVKMQYGSSDVKRNTSGKNSGKPLSLGDDFKSAASDALKKCASLLGMGLDLSLPIQERTMKALHATGTNLYGDNWKAKRQQAIRIVTGGRSRSSKDLMDVEARLLTAVMKGNLDAPLVRDMARKLKS